MDWIKTADLMPNDSYDVVPIVIEGLQGRRWISLAQWTHGNWFYARGRGPLPRTVTVTHWAYPLELPERKA